MKKKLIFITILILLVIFMIINILREEQINVVKVNDVGKMKPYDILFYDNYYNNNYEKWGQYTNAWQISPLLESDLIMYQITGDPKYLNRLIDNIDKVLAQRDIAKGRKNFRGEITPTWSSGSLYHFTFEDLVNEDGEPVIRVLAYGKGLWEPLSEGNHTTFITVSPGTNLNSFKIRIDNPERKYLQSDKSFDETYDNLIFKGEDDVIYDNGHVKIISLKTGTESPQDNPVYVERRRIKNQLQPYVVHTGLYTKVLVDLVELIKKSELNEYYQQKAEEYLKIATEAVAYHEKEWVDLPNNRGYYKIAEDALNYPNNVILPWNQMFGLLETEIGLYKITGDEKYRNRVEKAALYFMDHVYLDKEKDLYIWRYWEWEGYTKNESHTYAKLDAEFIARCYNAGIVFTEKDMSRFANTWATNFIKPNGKLADLVDGKGERNHEYYISYANDLSLWEPIIFEKSVEWLDIWKEKIEPNDVGYLKSIAKTIKYKRILEPDYRDQIITQTTECYRDIEY